MKLLNLTTIFFLLLFAGAHAQNPKAERIKALKVAFITTELKLSANESEKFWPVYNSYDSKQSRLRNQVMRDIRSRIDRGIDNLSEKEALSLVDQMQDAEQDIHENRMQLLNTLRKVIGPAKILKLKKAEEDFNRKLLKQYRGKRN